ncbi:VOC family protein [Frankia sp. AiPa1]|nr:VOC family protein [Frankia sp. AiPa1]
MSEVGSASETPVDAAVGGIVAIHHFGLTVRDIEASAAWYESVLGFTRVGEYEAPDGSRRKVFLRHRKPAHPPWAHPAPRRRRQSVRRDAGGPRSPGVRRGQPGRAGCVGPAADEQRSHPLGGRAGELHSPRDQSRRPDPRSAPDPVFRDG